MATMRRQAREIALQILFQTEFAPLLSVSGLLELFGDTANADVVSYAELMIEGVLAQKDEIDSLIQEASAHWKIQRMASVDRNVLRLATFEIVFAKEPIKPNIAINEAIEIAKKFGTTDSGGFVNGILDQVAKRKS